MQTQTNLHKQLVFTQILFSLIGLFDLGYAISSLQSIVIRFASNGNDVNFTSNINFIGNWFPPLFVAFFAFGWLTVHAIERMLLRQKIKIAGALFFVLLFGIFSGFWFHTYIDYEILRLFWFVVMYISSSGALLRYSLFHDESVLIIRKGFSREKESS